MLAAKIFDNDPPEKTAACLELVSRWDMGLEMALYGGRGFSGDTLSFVRDMPPEKKRLHLNHHAYSSSLLFRTRREGSCRPGGLLWTELLFCAENGIPAAIMHPFKNGLGLPPDSDGDSPEDVMACSIEASELFLARTGHRVAILFENLMETEPVHPRMLDILPRGDNPPAGLCLDIGHARVWGGRDLSFWLDQCSVARDSGIPLHFHLHGNDSLLDLHLAFDEAEERGFNSHPFFGPGGARGALSRILSDFPDAVHCLETGPSALPGNISWLLENGILPRP